MMQLRVAQRELAFIPDDEVGIGTDRDRSFARVQPIGLGGVCGGKFDKLLQGQAATKHAFRVQQGQPGFDAGAAWPPDLLDGFAA